MNKFRILLFSLLFVALAPVNSQVKIAISRTGTTYEKWLKLADTAVVPVNMYDLGIAEALQQLSHCSGLLLTGGEDVYPGYYGKLNDITRCEEINRYRDSLEMALIAKAISLNMPIFGICRGEQILNVALGGTLWVDIPTDIDSTVLHRCPQGSTSCLHTITLDAQSRFFRITGLKTTTVNSYHHQAVEKPAPGMRVSAASDNGVVEAIENADPGAVPFMMAVQFHPERLEQNPELARKLAVCFLEQVKKVMSDE